MLNQVIAQKFEKHIDGGRLNFANIQRPKPTEIESSLNRLGLPYKVDHTKNGMISITANDLRLDTELETGFGTFTVAKLIESPQYKEGKVRCQTPFRDSTSEAAFLSKSASGKPFLHDTGTGITHWLCDGEFEKLSRGQPSLERERVKPLFDINAYRADRLLKAPLQPIRWLLVDTLPVGVVGILVAPGGTGKSWLLIQLGISVATGILLANTWNVGEEGGVLLVLAEDDEDQLARRLHSAMASMPQPLPAGFMEKLHENLIVVPRVGEDNMLTLGDPIRKEVTETELVDRIISSAKQVSNLKLIVLDPTSRFRGGDENSAQHTTAFVVAAERIRKATGATVLLAHHANKSSSNGTEATQGASRGSSALTDGVRWQMNLMTFNESDAKKFGISPEDKPFYLTATITKNNYARPQTAVILKRGEGGFLTAAGIATALETAARDLDRAIVDLVSSEADVGRRFTKTGFADRFGGQEKCLKAGNNKVRESVQALLDKGKLSLDSKKKLTVSIRKCRVP